MYWCGYDLHVIEYQRPLLLPTLRIVWHQALIFDDQESFLAFELVRCWISHFPRKVLVLRFSPLLKNKKYPNSKSTRKGRRRTLNLHQWYLSKSLFVQFNFFSIPGMMRAFGLSLLLITATSLLVTTVSDVKGLLNSGHRRLIRRYKAGRSQIPGGKLFNSDPSRSRARVYQVI